MDLEDDEMEYHRELDFAEYGHDIHQLSGGPVHQPDESDPQVEVDPVLKHVPPAHAAFLNSQGLLDAVREVAGEADTSLPDFGVDRYVRVVEFIDECLRETFPGLGSVV